MIALARSAILAAAVTCGSGALGENTPPPVDAASGLIMAPGWDTVKTHCTVCHSAKFITFQRGDRETWTSMIRWMQKTQGLWSFDPKTEDTILTYLADNYPPGKPSRRKNLPPGDLP